MKKQMFTQLSFFLLLFCVLCSCSKSIESKYIGQWVDKRTESLKLNIEKSGDNYLVTNDRGQNKSYAGKLVDGILEISEESGNVRAIINEEGELIIAGNSFIKERYSLKYGLPGRWKSSNDSEVDIQFNGDNKFEVTFLPKQDNVKVSNCRIEDGWLKVDFEDDIETGNYMFRLNYTDYDKGYYCKSFAEKFNGRAVVGGRSLMTRISK